MKKPYYKEEKVVIYNGDCLEVLQGLGDNSIDSIVTDAPYELGFMGKSWDNTGIANNVEMWSECLRVLKPGGHLLAFSGTRTYHRMASAIEDAGFEVRDMIEWVYGSGFPKSLNIGKVTNKFLKTGNASWNGTGDSSNGALGYAKLQHKQGYRPNDYSNAHQNKDEITEELAKQWEGWGTALKPAHEPICMARKPLGEKTVAENVLKYGTGGINIDGTRVGTETVGWGGNGRNTEIYGEYKDGTPNPTTGRFPANLIHDNSEEVRECFPNESERFFKSIVYQAKASKSERNKGCEGLEKKPVAWGNQAKAELKRGNLDFKADGDATKHNKVEMRINNHPTVKPVKLMEYLIKMVTPKGGVVLDPFMGSGSTGVACKQGLYSFVGIDLEQEYCKIAIARIGAVENRLL